MNEGYMYNDQNKRESVSVLDLWNTTAIFFEQCAKKDKDDAMYSYLINKPTIPKEAVEEVASKGCVGAIDWQVTSELMVRHSQNHLPSILRGLVTHLKSWYGNHVDFSDELIHVSKLEECIHESVIHIASMPQGVNNHSVKEGSQVCSNVCVYSF